MSIFKKRTIKLKKNCFKKILLYFGYIVPYTLLIALNSFIIYRATHYDRSHNATNRRKTEMTRTILILTFLFIFTSLPSTIITGYFYDSVAYLNIGQIVINLINGIQFSYPAFNFFILYFTNKLFADEFKAILSKIKGNQVSMMNQTTNNTNNTN